MYLNISCPISENRIDGNVARVIALIIVVILSIGIILKSGIIILLMGIDFALRAFTSGEYSLVRLCAVKILRILKSEFKPMEAEPKKFSAGLGFIFSIAIALSLLAGNFTLAYIIGALLFACAFLEGAVNFCVGCYIYSYLIPFYKLLQRNKLFMSRL
jgi:hypothetical protein